MEVKKCNIIIVLNTAIEGHCVKISSQSVNFYINKNFNLKKVSFTKAPLTYPWHTTIKIAEGSVFLSWRDRE